MNSTPVNKKKTYMCLLISKSTLESSLKTADRPVKVYKVLSKKGAAPYHTKFTYKPGLNVAQGEPERIDMGDKYLAIYGGFLHAYVSERDASDRVYRKSARFNQVIEMYIPAGTQYYDNGIEIASPVLVWPEQL